MVVDIFRDLKEPSHIGKREARWLRKHRRNELGAWEELRGLHEKMNAMPTDKRRAMIENPVGQPLEDVQAIFDEQQVSRFSHIPAPSRFELSAAYKRASVAASKRFNKRITARQVKRCVQAWFMLEKSMQS